ncbi:MAG: DNA-binding protein WhiA [Lachnospiraceae bacterium]|nr:DNA-binding protein WhiA [Lachnospiraceae bacterium]MDY5741755.1 DNA-binding protein WhiA [Lachnospiraceae bacterium]
MSFSTEVKEEILHLRGNTERLEEVESAAVLWLSGQIKKEIDGKIMLVFTENISLVRKCFTFFQKAFNMKFMIGCCLHAVTKKRSYYLAVDTAGEQMIRRTGYLQPDRKLENDAERSAFLRMAFVVCGSVSDPNKDYHMEFVLRDADKAEQVGAVLESLGIPCKSIVRKQYHVIYIKEGDRITEVLTRMGAIAALLKMENIRVYRETRGKINRFVNCETANIVKAADNGSKQYEDIILIERLRGLDSLPPKLQEAAKLRLQYRDISLQELCMYLERPISKSGLNHRFKKIAEIAEELRTAE